MCTLTQRELDFLLSLRTGWRRLYRRELARLLKGGVEVEETWPDMPRTIIWRAVSS
ncbi:hypothetical protein [Bradyrhizobium sp.]|uniref:hypothetical protein n=1 Tax=Bradyrhizobium sp. TaxID=376 RepID=UPI0039E4137D